jgi:hypothetical protein
MLAYTIMHCQLAEGPSSWRKNTHFLDLNFPYSSNTSHSFFQYPSEGTKGALLRAIDAVYGPGPVSTEATPL